MMITKYLFFWEKFSLVIICFLACITSSAQTQNEESQKYSDLPEFTITANKSLFKVTGPNRYTYEVAKDSTLSHANTIEALRNVPILITQLNGEIKSINDKKLDFRINGLHDYILSDLSQALIALPAAVIKKINFTTQFDNNGSEVLVIDIITKTHLEGFRSLLTSSLSDTRWKNGIWGMTKLKRLSLHGSYFNTWIWQHASESGSEEYRYDSTDLFHYISNSTDKGYKADLHNYEISASYSIGDHSFIGIYGSILFKSNPHNASFSSTEIFDNNNNIAASYRRNDFRKMKDSEHQIAVKFEKSYNGNHPGHLKIGYEFYNRPYSSISSTSYFIQDLHVSLDSLFVNNYLNNLNKLYTTNTIATEWERLMSRNSQLTLYGKLRTRREVYSNTLSASPLYQDLWSSDKSKTSLFEIFGNLCPKIAYFTNKWEVRGGANFQIFNHRIHATGLELIINTNCLINPFISMAVLTNKKLLMELSYTQESLIPDITALDPYVDRTIVGELHYGNPFLKPETLHRIKLEISKKIGKLLMGGSVNTNFHNNIILSYQFLEQGMVNHTFRNIAVGRSVGISGYTSGRLHRNFFLRTNFYIDYQQYTSALLSINNSGGRVGVGFQLEQELPWRLTLGASGSYHTAPILLQGKGSQNFNYNLSLYRQFLNRKLSLSLEAESFAPLRYTRRSTLLNNQYQASTWTRSFHANFSFTLRYSFGKLKAQTKDSSISLDNNDIKTSY